jgi:TonB family protein
MMLPRSIVFIIVLVIALYTVSTGTCAAQDIQKTAEGMLNRARQLSDIRSPNAPAFRLNVTFSFIGHDLETLQGTYTETWISSTQWRRETVVGDFRRIEIGEPARHWRFDSANDLPEEAARVSALVEVFPPRKAQFQFDLITNIDASTQCAVTKATVEQHEKYAFCFDKTTQVLVENVAPQPVGQRTTDFACSYSEFHKLGDYSFPRDMTCFQENHWKIEAKVADLSLAPSPDAALFTPPAGSLEIGNCSQDPVPPKATSTPDPMYPARMDRESSVMLRMVVDVHGKPQGVRVTRSGGKQFDERAMASVRSWHFKPGTCNGEPIPLEVNVIMNFAHYR